MPCNAVATARAQVSQEALAALLTDDVVKSFLLDYLKRRYPSLNPREVEAWSGVHFVMSNYQIHIDSGRVIVSGLRNDDEITCKTLTDDITTFLTRVAGMLFQAQVQKAVKSRYAVSESSFAPNGALVLTVNL